MLKCWILFVGLLSLNLMVLSFHYHVGVRNRPQSGVAVWPQAPYQLPGPEELKKNFKRNGTVTKAIKR